MEPMCYIGLDVHKRVISYCVKDSTGQLDAEDAASLQPSIDSKSLAYRSQKAQAFLVP